MLKEQKTADNFAVHYKPGFLKLIQKKNSLLASITRQESRDLGKSSNTEKLKAWMKKSEKVILAAIEKVNEAKGILDTIQGEGD